MNRVSKIKYFKTLFKTSLNHYGENTSKSSWWKTFEEKWKKYEGKINQKYQTFTKAKIVSILSFLALVFYYDRFEHWYLRYIASEQHKRDIGAKKLLEIATIKEKPYYVSRKELENTFEKIIGSIEDEKYVIVVGLKGSGKTTILNHVANGKQGVIFVSINGRTTLENLEHKLLEAIDVKIEPWNQNKAQEVFGEICLSVRKMKDSRVEWVPTIIFEVEGSTKSEIIKELYKTAKQLSSDNVQARCIIVLSDANASLSMTPDPGRQKYLWISDFIEEEANNYLSKLGFTQDKMIRKEIFEKIGTRPLSLRDITFSKMSPKEFIDDRIQKDIKVVQECLEEDSRYKDLFIEMIKDENKNEIDSIHVMDICKLGTSKIAEGPAVKGFHVLAYDIQNGKFIFHSKSMYHATKQYLNENK